MGAIVAVPIPLQSRSSRGGHSIEYEPGTFRPNWVNASVEPFMSASNFKRGIAMAVAMHQWANRKGGGVATPDGFNRADAGTLASLMDSWLEWLRIRAYSPRTVETAHWALRGFVRWAERLGLHRPQAVTLAALERWQESLATAGSEGVPALAVETQRARLGHVQRFFAWLCHQQVLPSDPAAHLDLPRSQPAPLPRALSLQQVRSLLAVPDVGDALGVRDRAIIELLYATGIRRLELAMLDQADVDLDGGTLLVRHGKGGKARLLPLCQRAGGWLRRYLAEPRPLLNTRSDEPALFLTGYGGRFNVAALGNCIRKLMDAARIRAGGSCHLLRHSCATHMLERGADIRLIQQLLGHVRLDTTAIYTQVSIQHLKEVHSRCHPHGRATG